MLKRKSTSLGRTPANIRRAVIKILQNGEEVVLEDLSIHLTPAMLPALSFVEAIETHLEERRRRGGGKGGRPRTFVGEDKAAAEELWHDTSVPVQEIIERFGVSLATLKRVFGPRHRTDAP